MIHLKGLDIASLSSKNKKTEGVPSKILNKHEQKAFG
jgi:hypothetical protein